jgi:hypothetical protein
LPELSCTVTELTRLTVAVRSAARIAGVIDDLRCIPGRQSWSAACLRDSPGECGMGLLRSAEGVVAGGDQETTTAAKGSAQNTAQNNVPQVTVFF